MIQSTDQGTGGPGGTLGEVGRLLSEWLDLLMRTDSPYRWITVAFVVVAGWYLSRLVVRLLGRQVARRFRRPSVTKTVLRGIRSIVLALSIIVAAIVAGIGSTDIVLSVGVFSAVLGLVLAPIIGSAINGLFVLADQPYEIGDMIELVEEGDPVGTRGFVEDITIRYTKVFTLDNTFLVIPNATMRERDVINYSAEDERSRLSMEVTVTYEGDLDEARAVLEESARALPEVIESGPDIRIGSARYPAEPVAYIRSFADHGVRLVLRYWVKNPYKITTVESKIQEEVWKRLPDADVSIPYPHSHVVFDDTSGEARIRMREAEGRATEARESDGRMGRPPSADRSDEEFDDLGGSGGSE